MWARSRRSANWRRGSSTGPVTHRGLPVRILGAKPFYLFDELFHLCLDVETHPDVRIKLLYRRDLERLEAKYRLADAA